MDVKEIKLERIDDCRWRIPKTGAMRVSGLIFSNLELIKSIQKDESLRQVANVATLPGIVGHSLAMPDIHWGYGFCIGGVAATDPEQGGRLEFVHPVLWPDHLGPPASRSPVVVHGVALVHELLVVADDAAALAASYGLARL